MSKLSSILFAGAAGLLLVALPAVAKPKADAFTTATIINTGSTNTSGYTLTLHQNKGVSDAVWVQMPNSEGGIKNTSKILVTLSDRFFHDLNDAMPLTSLPVHHGMRSASFGTATFITYKGQKSPDLTFAGDPRTVALKADIDAITKTLHIGNMPRRPLPPIVIHADK